MSLLYFKDSGTKIVNADATVGVTTDALDLSKGYSWSIQIFSDSIVGSGAQFTVECSNDGNKWDEYDTNSTGVSIDDSFAHSTFEFRYIRLVYTPGSVTAGTISLTINTNHLGVKRWGL